MNGTIAPKSLEGILKETFSIYKSNFLRLIAIVAIVQVPIFILYGIYIVLILMMMPTYGGLETPAFSSVMGLVLIFLMIPIGLLMFSASILMAGAVIHAVAEQHFNRSVSIGRAYGFAWRRLGDMFGAAVLVYLALLGIYLAAILICVIISAATGASYGLAMFFAMFFLVIFIAVPAIIYLATNWSFILQTALLEGCGPTSALSHSSALVKQSWWRVLGIVLLLLLIVQTIFMIFYMPAMMGTLGGVMSGIINEASSGVTPYAAPEFPIWTMIWAMIGGAIGNIISVPIFMIGITLLYFDLRVRKQGYSLNALADEIGLRNTSTDTAA